MTIRMERPTRSIWLDITQRCPLECVHCYADSGPTQSHGTMTADHWWSTIDQAARLGVRRVTMIGGEPTLHPHFGAMLCHALDAGLKVEVYSNLFAIPARIWELLKLPGVHLATSYYSDDLTQHDAITTRPGSHAKTRANIAKAVTLGIPIRVGLINLTDRQRTDQARAELIGLGVDPNAIGADFVRAFGRGAGQDGPDESHSCGGCGHGKAAILPDGSVTPCVFTRTATAGNVTTDTLADVLGGERFAAQVSRLDSLRDAAIRCVPDAAGNPQDARAVHRDACEPDTECTPGYPLSGCNPRH
jgi:MoaA/NifB/PqqE/SkfB family radical SAM enzyme